MAVIKLVEDYAIRQLRNDVTDSLRMAGEQAILLSLYHAGDPDATPCPECGDDVYNSPEKECMSCYGTMFNGGVRHATKIWTLFTDHQVSEDLSKRGLYQPDHRSFQFEAFPLVTERDIVVRIRSWSGDGVPLVLEGFYLLGQVARRSLRTGNRFGQYWWDVVGQKSQVAELPQKMHGVTTYPIVGQSFPDVVMVVPPTPKTALVAPVEPDTRVVYFPFNPATGEPTTGGGDVAAGFTFIQAIPASIWTIAHTLGYDPTVTIIIGDEEVDAEIEYPNNSVVVINFGVPVAGTARLT